MSYYKQMQWEHSINRFSKSKICNIWKQKIKGVTVKLQLEVE